MKKDIIKFFKFIFWVFYRLTPKGKKKDILEQGFQGILQSKELTRLNVADTAAKVSKPKKILTFYKGNSITKRKNTNHEIVQKASIKHKKELKEVGIKLSKKGKFQNA